MHFRQFQIAMKLKIMNEIIKIKTLLYSGGSLALFGLAAKKNIMDNTETSKTQKAKSNRPIPREYRDEVR